MPIERDVAELGGLVAETILYGILVVLTLGTLYVLIRKRGKGSRINYTMVGASLLMWALATGQLVIDVTAIFEAYVPLDRVHRSAKLANISAPLNSARRAVFFTMMILGDVMVIYRAWVVWARDWKIILVPAGCSFTSAVLAYMSIWATGHREQGMFLLQNAWKYGLAVFILSLIANVLSVFAIAFRIWQLENMFYRERGVYTSGRTSMRPVIRILVESGALNAAYLIVYTTVLCVEHGSKYSLPIVADIGTPLVGIVFSLVIVRVGMEASARDHRHVENGSGKPAHATSGPSHITPMAFIPGQGASTLGTTAEFELDTVDMPGHVIDDKAARLDRTA